MAKKKIVTILESDEGAKSCYVQINHREDIGTGIAGDNARHEFKGTAWKGTIEASLAAEYPGAEVHTVETMNRDVISPIMVDKGTHVMRAGVDVAIPKEENKRLDQVEIREFADANGQSGKAEDLIDLSVDAAKTEILKRKAAAEDAAAEAGDVGAVVGEN